MTRQTYDRAPRLTKLATAHISKGDYDYIEGHAQSSVMKKVGRAQFSKNISASYETDIFSFRPRVYAVVCREPMWGTLD